MAVMKRKYEGVLLKDLTSMERVDPIGVCNELQVRDASRQERHIRLARQYARTNKTTLSDAMSAIAAKIYPEDSARARERKG